MLKVLELNKENLIKPLKKYNCKNGSLDIKPWFKKPKLEESNK